MGRFPSANHATSHCAPPSVSCWSTRIATVPVPCPQPACVQLKLFFSFAAYARSRMRRSSTASSYVLRCPKRAIASRWRRLPRIAATDVTRQDAAGPLHATGASGGFDASRSVPKDRVLNRSISRKHNDDAPTRTTGSTRACASTNTAISPQSAVESADCGGRTPGHHRVTEGAAEHQPGARTGRQCPSWGSLDCPQDAGLLRECAASRMPSWVCVVLS
jgi:hypothetical protein